LWVDVVFAVLLIITALFTIYYWADFYIRGGVHVIKDEWYIKFEKAFPPADMWMAACALIGAIGLLTVGPKSYGLMFSLLAAGSLIFLALMDIAFNVENNLYRLVATSSQMTLELVINLWCLFLGVALIAYLWLSFI
jgi:hypothetical protein